MRVVGRKGEQRIVKDWEAMKVEEGKLRKERERGNNKFGRMRRVSRVK